MLFGIIIFIIFRSINILAGALISCLKCDLTLEHGNNGPGVPLSAECSGFKPRSEISQELKYSDLNGGSSPLIIVVRLGSGEKVEKSQ